MSPANSKKPLIPYLRQSRKKEVTISIEEQRRDIRKWAEANDARLAPEIVEQGVSGSKHWRDRDLGRAMAAVEAGEASGIIVAYQSRLSREQGLAQAELWEAFDKAGARLVCAAEGLDTANPNGNADDDEMIFQIKAAVARREWKRARANWEKATRNAAERGVHISPRVPFGYRQTFTVTPKGDRIQGPLEQEPAAADAVREVFRRRAAGAGWTEIVEYMDAEGHKTPIVGDGTGPTGGGGDWTEGALRKLVANSIYKAEPPRADHFPEEALAELKIVSPRVWAAAQPGSRGPSTRSAEGAMLSGLLRCATCGGTLTAGMTQKKNGRRIQSYRCRRRSSVKCSRPMTVSGNLIEPLVMDAAREWLGEIGDLDNEVQTESPELAEAVADARYEVEQFVVHTPAGMPGYAEGLAARTAIFDAAQAALDAVAPTLSIVKPADSQAALDEMSVPEQREFLREVFESVTVAPGPGEIADRVTLNWLPWAVAEQEAA